jgi:sarcosine oxidase subunit gamma
MQAAGAQWGVLENMWVAERFVDADDVRAITLGVADLSYRYRTGFKGPGTAAWLEQLRVPVPPAPNTWLPLGNDGGLVARLGRTEFLIEDGTDGRTSAKLAHREPAAGVYPVLRQDISIVLCGSAVPELLLETCNVNCSALALDMRPVVLTSMAGVAVTVVPGERCGRPYYRLWADGTYGFYLWETLAGIAAELGGGPVGLATIAELDAAASR